MKVRPVRVQPIASLARGAAAVAAPLDSYAPSTAVESNQETSTWTVPGQSPVAAKVAALREEGYRFKLETGFWQPQVVIKPEEVLKTLATAQDRASLLLESPQGEHCRVATIDELLRVGQVPFDEVSVVAPPEHRQSLQALLQAVDEVDHPAFRHLSRPQNAAHTSALYHLLVEPDFEQGCAKMHQILEAVTRNSSAMAHPITNLLKLYRKAEEYPQKRPLALALMTAFEIKELPELIDKFCGAGNPHLAEVAQSLTEDADLRRVARLAGDSLFKDDDQLGFRLRHAPRVLDLFKKDYQREARPLLRALTDSTIPFEEGVELVVTLAQSSVQITDHTLENGAHFKALEPLPGERRTEVAEKLRQAFKFTSILDRADLVKAMVVAASDEQLWPLCQNSELRGNNFSDIFNRIAEWRPGLGEQRRLQATRLALELLPHAPRHRRQELLEKLHRISQKDALWGLMQKAEGREGLKRLEDLGEIEALDSAAGDLEVSYHEDHLLVGDTPLFRD